MAGEQPSDLGIVRYAFRLGWSLAELRGRYRPDRFNHRDPGHTRVFDRNGYSLPLASERSPTEIRKELIDTYECLSAAVKLGDDASEKAWAKLKVSLENLEERGADQQALWTGTAHRFYLLDAHIQDTLVLEASQAAGYQLGRGLAETYWALQPDCPASAMGSWEFLLGAERCETLRRLAARLSAYVGSDVLAAIDGPLREWEALASDATQRGGPDVELELYRQGLLWRDLIRGERSTSDLTAGNAKAPASVWNDLKLDRKVAAGLSGPLIIGGASVVALVAGASLLASGSGNTAVTTIVSILGALGLTSSSLYGRAKADVTSLLTTLSQAVHLEKVSLAANLCPVPIKAALASAQTQELTSGSDDGALGTFTAHTLASQPVADGAALPPAA